MENNLVDKLKKYLKKHWSDVSLFLLLITVVAGIAVATIAKAPLGDSSIDITNGMMIMSGKVPYADVYLYNTPFTAYLASLVFFVSSSPIKMIGLLMILNLLLNIGLIAVLAKKLQLKKMHAIIAYVTLLSLQLSSLISFTHHAFNITVTNAIILCLVVYSKTASKKVLYTAAGLAVLNFFISFHVGFATMCMVVVVALFKKYWTNSGENAEQISRIGLFQVVIFCAILGLLATVGNVPLQKMFHATMSNSSKQYLSNYESYWKTNYFGLVTKAISKVSKKPADIALVTVAASQNQTKQLYTYENKNVWTKIFLQKTGLINSVASFIFLSTIIIFFTCFIVLEIKRVYLTKKIAGLNEIHYLFAMSAGMLFVVLLTPFQLGFGPLAAIYLLGVKTLHDNGAFKGVIRLVAFGLLASLCLLSVGNATLLIHEYVTRDYFPALKGERVWNSPFYYGVNFVPAVKEVGQYLKNNNLAGETMIMYPRASEFYYIYNSIPLSGSSMVSFAHPDQVYRQIVLNAEVSKIIIYYFSPLSSPANPEEIRAFTFMQPALDKSYTEVLKNDYFTIFRHK